MIPEPVGWPEKLGLSILETLYPRRCVCCGALLLFRGSLRHPICADCSVALVPIEAERRCSRCSVPLVSELLCCTRCSERTFAFASNFSLYEYRGAVRQIISCFKFANNRSLARLIARLLLPELQRRHPSVPVVPVPGNPRSVRRRGWDPMQEVARALRRTAGTKILTAFRRSGGPQKGLHYRERLDNIRGSIRLRTGRAAAGGLPGRLVLLDDIFTSGATAEECARMLRSGGAGEVHVLTLAIEY